MKDEHVMTARSRVVFGTAIVLTLGLLSSAGAYSRPGLTERVSVGADGRQGTRGVNGFEISGDSINGYNTAISDNGRFVAFWSPLAYPQDSMESVAGGAIFLKDRETGAIVPVTVDSRGRAGAAAPVPGFATHSAPAINANGRFVAFQSISPDLDRRDLPRVSTDPNDANAQLDVFLRDVTRGTTELLSVGMDGFSADGRSEKPSISSDGRFVAFSSSASNLIKGDTNGVGDVFVLDRKQGEMSRVSLSSDGDEADGESRGVAINRTGRYVVFASSAKNLVDGPDSLESEWFLHDRKTHRTEIVSVPPDGSGSQALGGAGDAASISDDGRYVAFNTGRKDMVPNDTNRNSLSALPHLDVYVLDRKTERIERVSVTSYGGQADNPSWGGVEISGDGRFIVFGSQAGTLVGGDTGGDAPVPGSCCGDLDIFVHDRLTGTTTMVDVGPGGGEANNCTALGNHRYSAYSPAFSRTGRYVSYLSCADNLVAGDSNDAEDAFVRDLGLPLGLGIFGEWQSGQRLTMEGAPGFDRSGTAWIDDLSTDAFASKLGSTGEILGMRISHRPLLGDLFVSLELDHLPPTPRLAALTAGAVYGMSLEHDGIAYEVRAVSTGLGPSGETTAGFGLFVCPRSLANFQCSKIRDLRGGFGTTGAEVVFSLPLEALGLERGGRLTHVEAFSSLGSSVMRPLRVIDSLKV